MALLGLIPQARDTWSLENKVSLHVAEVPGLRRVDCPQRWVVDRSFCYSSHFASICLWWVEQQWLSSYVFCRKLCTAWAAVQDYPPPLTVGYWCCIYRAGCKQSNTEGRISGSHCWANWEIKIIAENACKCRHLGPKSLPVSKWSSWKLTAIVLWCVALTVLIILFLHRIEIN